jgi:ribonucleoside-diphosphate reductase alpha chain
MLSQTVTGTTNCFNITKKGWVGREYNMIETHKIAIGLGWNAGEDYPTWGNNDLYLTTILGGYLQKKETPRDAYLRLASTASSYLKDDSLTEKFFDIFWNGWLVPATPVMSSFGTTKGLPISCFSGVVSDDMYEIGRKELEMRMLSKHGGGTAYSFSEVRAAGTPIQNGALGTSDGIVPFIKSFDSTIMSAKQGQLRRGAVAMYLDIEHKDYSNFLEIREPKGDINRQCHNIHQGAVITDRFMRAVKDGAGEERALWTETLKKRVKTGEPYVMFVDNANRALPKNWKENNLIIKHSNLCSEIFLPTDGDHTLVCCLSSLNLHKFDEWKNTDTVSLAIKFLDSVIEEFIQKSKGIKGIEDATRFAIKSRALGLGTLGYHSYLQSKGIPFISIYANGQTHKIFGTIKAQAEKASEELAEKYGEPEWCKGTGKRNLTLMAIAPNRSSSKLAGGLSQGVEPIAANIYVDDDAKGLHIRRNPELTKILKAKERDIPEVWDQIMEDKGSVINIRCLSDEEKDVFKTFKEINQLELVKQAGLRQVYIDQGQSINLAFAKDAPAKFINLVHYTAWEVGLKSLYYFRSESNLRADTAQQRDLYSECVMCEG